MTGAGSDHGREPGANGPERFLRALAAGGPYAVRVREITGAAQAGHLPAVFGDDGLFRGLETGPGEQLPTGWKHDGGLAVPDPATAAGQWVTDAIAHAEEFLRDLVARGSDAATEVL